MTTSIEGADRLPPVLYVPTTAPTTDEAPRIAMTFLADGRTAVFAYSALDRLHDLYPGSPAWALLTIADLQRAHDDVSFDLLMVDQQPVVREDGGDPA